MSGLRYGRTLLHKGEEELVELAIKSASILDQHHESELGALDNELFKLP
jgi:hypothetical protein